MKIRFCRLSGGPTQSWISLKSSSMRKLHKTSHFRYIRVGDTRSQALRLIETLRLSKFEVNFFKFHKKNKKK